MLVTGSDDKSVKVWNLKTKSKSHDFVGVYFTKGNVTGLTLAEKSSIGAIVTDLNELSLFNWETGSVRF
jgi:WD40 repeat protein